MCVDADKQANEQPEAATKEEAVTSQGRRAQGEEGDGRENGPAALVLFAGSPRVGGLPESFKAIGVECEAIDLVVGGSEHDLSDEKVVDRIHQQIAKGKYRWVWMGIPCASFSALRLDDPRRLRSRAHPLGVPEMSDRDRQYIEAHNRLVRASAYLAAAALVKGATVVIENPADRGEAGTPWYSRAWEEHAPLWLMPQMQEIIRLPHATRVTFPQCAFRGAYQKWTTLLAVGPDAKYLAELGELRCEHERHTAVAKGGEAAKAAEYPALMSATVVGLLTGGEALHGAGPQHWSGPAATEWLDMVERKAWINREWATRWLDETHGKPQELARGEARPETTQTGWDLGLLPEDWPEKQVAQGERTRQERTAALRYLSRRRAEAESAEELKGRQLPTMGEPPLLPKPQQPCQPVEWPAGAPQPPISIDQLFHQGVYARIQTHIEQVMEDMRRLEEAAERGQQQRSAPARPPAVFRAEETQPAWARECVWDTSIPTNCVPLKPFSEAEKPRQEVNAAFFVRWGDRLQWPDQDMIDRVARWGCDSRATCARDTVIYGHHGGLRANYGPAREAVEHDVREGWITRGVPHLRTVPARLVPKNVVLQEKWRLNDKGELVKKQKWRVTTDDSIEARGSDSRNHTIPEEEIHNVELPTLRKFAEAVAILKSAAEGARTESADNATDEAGVQLWTLDLEQAYRRLAVARQEWWLQGFVWWDGVRLDERCVFGSAHLVDLFQRTSSFVLAVARRRVAAFEKGHPHTGDRARWLEARRDKGLHDGCAPAFVYIDDVFGATCQPSAETRRRIVENGSTTVVFTVIDVIPGGRVELMVLAARDRTSAHLMITRRTYEEAGWGVAVEKVQMGDSIELLGLKVEARGEGRVSVPTAKREGLCREIEELGEAEGQGKGVSRAQLERLCGRLSHIAAVVAEGKAYLAPFYKLLAARAKQRPTSRLGSDGGVESHIRQRSRKLQRIPIQGGGPVQGELQRALAWWSGVLREETSVPLAPRIHFPEPGGGRSAAYVFTDAAREDGTGFGGFSLSRREGETEPELSYMARPWGQETLRRLQQNEISMPAGEMIGAVAIIDAILRRFSEVTHVVCFTDSKATAAGLTTGSSGAMQLNRLLIWLFERHRGKQFLGIHCPGVQNRSSDKLSRGQWKSVLSEAIRRGWQPVELCVAPDLRGVVEVELAAMPARKEN